jgi:hypothetical protein
MKITVITEAGAIPVDADYQEMHQLVEVWRATEERTSKERAAWNAVLDCARNYVGDEIEVVDVDIA